MSKKPFMRTFATAEGGANLFIKGVGGFITTEALLASYFTFVEGEVTDFIIDGDDISATITNTNYNVNDDAFYLGAGTGIKEFRETAGYLKELGYRAFMNANELVYFEGVGVTHLNGRVFWHTGGVLNFDNIHLPALTTMTLDGNFRANTTVGTLNLPLCTDLGQYPFLAVNAGNTIVLNSMVNLSNSSMLQLTKCIVNMPNLLTIGATVGDDNIANGWSSATVLNVPAALETINGGGIEGDLQDGITNMGITVNFVY